MRRAQLSGGIGEGTADPRPVAARSAPGILLLDKPAGLSSNAALQRVRRTLGVEKAGHVGSLDPLATGMLPICLGEATKIAGDVLSGRKCYRFTIRLGARTMTGDAEGEIVETAPVPVLDPSVLEAVRRRFVGRQTQIPPMYSALKRNGQPLYKLARAGLEVERPAREIELFRLALLEVTSEQIELETVCSKGTYVRVLAEDIARALGTCGYVGALRRIYVEPFALEAMETLESIAGARELGHWPKVLPADWPLTHLPRVSVVGAHLARLTHGQAVPVPPADAAAVPLDSPARIRLYDGTGRFLGIGELDGCGNVQPRRLFVL
jgi:tRNA pseudouridine55 synthase